LEDRKTMFRKLGALVASAAVLAAVSAGSAAASVTVYSGNDYGAGAISPKPNAYGARADYLAAAASLGADQLITFESQAVGAFSSLDLGNGVTLTGKTLVDADQKIANAPACLDALCGYNITVGGSKFFEIYGGEATFSFLNPISSFGAFIAGAQIEGIHFAFTDGSSQSVDVPGQYGTSFVGFTDPGKSISSVSLLVGNDILSVDDVHFTFAAPAGVGVVPEPASWAMMIAGFSGVGALLRRRRAGPPLVAA
jgi:hypothetical protein